MKKALSGTFFQHAVDGADLSVRACDLLIPKEDTNTFEGCEFLDNNFRMGEQPSDEDERVDEQSGRDNAE